MLWALNMALRINKPHLHTHIDTTKAHVSVKDTWARQPSFLSMSLLSGYFERPTRKLVATYWVQSYSNSLKHPNFCDYFMDSWHFSSFEGLTYCYFIFLNRLLHCYPLFTISFHCWQVLRMSYYRDCLVSSYYEGAVSVRRLTTALTRENL